MDTPMSMPKPKLKPKDAPDLGRFDWQDPFRMEDQLSEEERMLRDAAREFAGERAQFLLSGAALAIYRAAPGKGCLRW